MTSLHPDPWITRMITFLVGNPYKPLFAAVTEWGICKSKQNDFMNHSEIGSSKQTSPKVATKKSCFSSPQICQCFTWWDMGPQESCFFHSSPFFAMSFRSTGCFSGTLLQHILSLEGRCSSHSDSRGGGLAHTWASDPKRWLSIHSRLICWGSNHYQHLILTLKIGGIKRWMIRIIFFCFFWLLLNPVMKYLDDRTKTEREHLAEWAAFG